MLFSQWDALERKIEALEKRIMAWHRESPESRRLASIPGIGPINATLMAATVPDARQFRSGREFAAWIGLVPKERSSGGKQRLGHISKRGNPYMRRLLIVGAHAVLRWTKRGKGMQTPWLLALIERHPPNIVAVAIANKMARIAWALMMRNETYRSATA
jgi:transposase